MNFAREDAVDDLLLNEVVWRCVRGSDSPMPAPVRAAFVFGHRGEKDQDWPRLSRYPSLNKTLQRILLFR